MSDFWMFLGTIVVGLAWLAIANPVLRSADNAALRAGLLLNGIDRAERDRIMKWRETGEIS